MSLSKLSSAAFLEPPDWFVEHCVKIYGESGGPSCEALTIVPDDQPSGIKNLNTYQLHASMYEALGDTVSKTSVKENPMVGNDSNSEWDSIEQDGTVRLYCPGTVVAHDFLTAAVERLSHDHRAHMIILPESIPADLAAWFNHAKEQAMLRPLRRKGDESPSRGPLSWTLESFFESVLATPSRKRGRKRGRQQALPTLLHVVIDNNRCRPHNPSSPAMILYDCIKKKMRSDKHLLKVFTLSFAPMSGIQPGWTPLVPVQCPTQRSLLEQHHAEYTARSNIARLQNGLRDTDPDQHHENTSFLQPCVTWKFPADADAARILRDCLLLPEEITGIITRLRSDASVQRAQDIIYQVCGYIKSCNALLAKWNNDNPKTRSPRFLNAQATLMADREKFEHELEFLPLVVNPDTISDSWDTITVELHVQNNITRMISHALSEGERYGVLKEANLGGAMLYGPPGTGKTHLARVLAKESAASMINITAAEIESKWTGETEGRIKALFNLARLLSPCIIFIDEADSLLKARQVDDKSWERSRISQFLTEMDGLKTQDRDSNGNHPPPFLILSTNYPSSIDHAIMRRVPGRFYLGPPTSESRRTIIGSLMRDEDVDPTVHFSDLAKQTDGFSGSDLQTLCVEAASISQSRLGTYSSRRLVTMADFANALYLVRPTITRQAMKDLERFAKDYDPISLPLIQNAMRLPSVPSPQAKSNNRAGQNAIAQPSSGTPKATSNNPATRTVMRTPELGLSQASPVPTPSRIAHKQDPPERELSVAAILESSAAPKPIGTPALVYEPLDKDRHEIRLLEVHTSNTDEGTFSCTLRKVSLLDDPEFTALSYVWGDASDTKEVIVNGVAKSVTINLAYALPWARHHWMQRFPDREVIHFRIWVDAICIDQKNIQERNQQVTIMTEIYSRAELVICQIARENDLAILAIDIYRSIFKLLFNSATGVSTEELATRTWLKHLPTIWLSADETTASPDDRHCKVKAWEALRSFWQLEYWLRVWIFQETGLAQEALLICDGYSLPADHLDRIASLLAQVDLEDIPGERVEVLEGFCPRCYGNLLYPPRWKIFAEETDHSLPYLQAVFNNSLKASDPKDLVYGLLWKTQIPLEVDYSKDVSLVYWDFVQARMQEAPQALLELISYAGVNCESQAMGLPTWMPNLALASHVAENGNGVPYDIGCMLNNPKLFRSEKALTIDFPRLRTSGVQVLTVEEVVQAPGLNESALLPTFSGSLQTSKFFDFMRKAGNNQPKYTAGGTTFGAILDAILMGGPHHSGYPERLLPQALSLFLMLVRSYKYDPRYGAADSARFLNHNFQQPYDPQRGDEVVSWFINHFFPELSANGSYCIPKDLKHRWENPIRTVPHATLMTDYKVFRTNHGYVGRGVAEMREGDEVWLLEGYLYPMVLRREENHFLLVGSCYIAGLFRIQYDKENSLLEGLEEEDVEIR